MPRVTIDSSGQYQPKFWCDICETSQPLHCEHLPAGAAKWQPEPNQDPEPIDDGGPAFPLFGRDAWGGTSTLGTGMSLRDKFAEQAMNIVDWDDGRDHGADCCYLIADAMLRARAKQ